MTRGNLREQIVRKNLSVSLRDSLDNDSLLWFRSEYRDDFEASLSLVIRFLLKQKVGDDDVYRITSIVGELGNNNFDHNLGRWPNSYIGNFVALLYNKKERLLEIVVIDFGIGFKESLEGNEPPPASEVEAIKMGLAGITGRVGEQRGNGLRTVVAWLKKYYRGKMRIQSNEGIIVIEKDKSVSVSDKKILGTEIYLRLFL